MGFLDRFGTRTKSVAVVAAVSAVVGVPAAIAVEKSAAGSPASSTSTSSSPAAASGTATRGIHLGETRVWRDAATGQLLEKPLTVYKGTDRLVSAANRMGSVGRRYGVPIVFAYAPRKQEGLAAQLPPYWSLEPTWKAKRTLMAAFRANGTAVDLTGAATGPAYWYRTDHHWNHLAAERAAGMVLAALRRAGAPVGPAVGSWRMKTDLPAFRGTAARKIPATEIGRPDRFMVPVPTAKMSLCTGSSLEDLRCGLPIYNEGFARRPDPFTNRYMIYFGGDPGMSVVSGPGKGTLIIGKDSFALPVVARLAPHFKKVILVDERHYTGGKLSSLVSREKPMAVLLLHSITPMHGSNFNSAIWG